MNNAHNAGHNTIKHTHNGKPTGGERTYMNRSCKTKHDYTGNKTNKLSWHYTLHGGEDLGGCGTGLCNLTDDTVGGMNTVSSLRSLTCWQYFLIINTANRRANREIIPNHAMVPEDVTEYNLKDSYVSSIKFSMPC
jgi:hypothetical protein